MSRFFVFWFVRVVVVLCGAGGRVLGLAPWGPLWQVDAIAPE